MPQTPRASFAAGVASPPYRLHLKVEHFDLARPFIISRGAKADLDLVTVELHDRKTGVLLGRGECRPYARYRETTDSICTAIEAARAPLERGIFPDTLHAAAANAVNCALLDATCKRNAQPIATTLQIGTLPPHMTTCVTVSVDTPAAMAAQTQHYLDSGATILKIKLGQGDNLPRLKAIAQQLAAHSRPTHLSLDFNESCTLPDGTPDLAQCNAVMAFAAAHQVRYVEQPFPQEYDTTVAHIQKHGVPVIADESCHDSASLPHLLENCGYDGVNLKLGKTGGLTRAIAMLDTLKTHYPHALVGIGSMLSSSLSAAADYTLAACAQAKGIPLISIDIDSPSLMGHAHDRPHALMLEGNCLHAPAPELWGGATLNLGEALTPAAQQLAQHLNATPEADRPHILTTGLTRILRDPHHRPHISAVPGQPLMARQF